MTTEGQALPPKEEILTAPVGRLLLTPAILGILGAIYLQEIARPVDGGTLGLFPTTDTLIAYGALVRDLVVERGEWYRILTGPLLHASPMHILFNGLAFWYAAGA